MTDIETFMHASLATLRLYRNSVVFNRRAATLLSPYPSKRIRFLSESDAVYVGGTDSRKGIAPTRRKGRKGLEINSRSLCAALSQRLGGHGVFRIREDRYTFHNGETCYLIERVMLPGAKIGMATSQDSLP